MNHTLLRYILLYFTSNFNFTTFYFTYRSSHLPRKSDRRGHFSYWKYRYIPIICFTFLHLFVYIFNPFFYYSGHVFPEDMRHLIVCIKKVLKEMKVSVPIQYQTSWKHKAEQKVNYFSCWSWIMQFLCLCSNNTIQSNKYVYR